MAFSQVGNMSSPAHEQAMQRPVDESSEQALIGQIAAGDRRAFELLFQTYGERIFRYALRLISDSGKAEEVTNDVMLEVWKSAAKFEGRSKVSTWLLGITRHLALNAIRRKQVQTVDVDDAPELVAAELSTPALEHDQETMHRTLKTALQALSPEHRDVVELTFFHGCSYSEIADIVKCPENTVKTRMFHAKKQLQGLLVEAGVDLANVELAS